jgi:hypothetical protein
MTRNSLIDSESDGLVWDYWVGEQSVAEFLGYCDPNRPLADEVAEYVEAVLAGAVFGPVEFDGDADAIVALLVEYIKERENDA